MPTKGKIKSPKPSPVPKKTKSLSPHAFETELEIIEKAPRYQVLVTPDVLLNMECIISLACKNNKEVGWLGTVSVIDDGYLIDEIFVPEQNVNQMETEISTEGTSKMVEEILKEPDGIDKVNRIRFWGHLHPWKSTSPSAQDNTQATNLMKDVDDFFIRGIANDAGQIEFNLYLIEKQVVVIDCPWQVFRYADTSAAMEYWKTQLDENITENATIYNYPAQQRSLNKAHWDNKLQCFVEWDYKKKIWIEADDDDFWIRNHSL